MYLKIQFINLTKGDCRKNIFQPDVENLYWGSFVLAEKFCQTFIAKK